MGYVLILLVSGWLNQSPLSVTTADFHTKQACEAAGEVAIAKFAKTYSAGTSTFVCAEKGTPHPRPQENDRG